MPMFLDLKCYCSEKRRKRQSLVISPWFEVKVLQLEIFNTKYKEKISIVIKVKEYQANRLFGRIFMR